MLLGYPSACRPLRLSPVEETSPDPQIAPEAKGADVLMFSRRTCGLCDEARAVVEAELTGTAFRFREVFIDGDEALEREYGLRVPVVLVEGLEEFEYRIEPARFHVLVGGPRSDP
jgi:Glutaredoxin-like domain (DUF836)